MTNANQSKDTLHTQLENLGLTENDAKVYLYLLERGTAFGGSKIAAALGLHRQYVHYSLQKLLQQVLIEEIPSGVRKKYKALPPQYLTHLAKKNLESAELVAKELDLISAIGAEQDFEVYRGTKQVLDFEVKLVDSLKEHEVQYIIGGGAEAFVNFFGDEYEPISNMAHAKHLKSKYVGAECEVAWLAGRVADVFGNDFEYRVLPMLPKTIVQTVIRFDTVTLYTFGNPALVYFIKSKTVAADYKKFFDMLWNMAK